MILWKKELCTKFCGVLISCPEVMKLQSSEFGVSNVMPANVQKNSSVVFFAFFSVNFMENKPSTQFYGRFGHFS